MSHMNWPDFIISEKIKKNNMSSAAVLLSALRLNFICLEIPPSCQLFDYDFTLIASFFKFPLLLLSIILKFAFNLQYYEGCSK